MFVSCEDMVCFRVVKRWLVCEWRLDGCEWQGDGFFVSSNEMVCLLVVRITSTL